MATVSEQLARIDERVKSMKEDNTKEHKTIAELLKQQNGRIRINEKSIAKIVGIGVASIAIFGIIVAFVK